MFSTTVPFIEHYDTLGRHDTSLLASLSLLTDVWIKAVDKAAFLEQSINSKHTTHCYFNQSPCILIIFKVIHGTTSDSDKILIQPSYAFLSSF